MTEGESEKMKEREMEGCEDDEEEDMDHGCHGSWRQHLTASVSLSSCDGQSEGVEQTTDWQGLNDDNDLISC